MRALTLLPQSLKRPQSMCVINHVIREKRLSHIINTQEISHAVNER